MSSVEIVPAILRKTYEDIAADWERVESVASHIQIDITDGIFAGDGTYRQVNRFKQLPNSHKIELHMMVQRPSDYVDDVIDLLPARCVFHLEAFAGGDHIGDVYRRLRQAAPQTELGLALNPDSPNRYLEEQVSLIDYVLFMGYNPGWAGQELNPLVLPKIGQWHESHPTIPIAVDGHVTKETIPDFVKVGARILCSNSAIFKNGNPKENYEQLKLVAQGAMV